MVTLPISFAFHHMFEPGCNGLLAYSSPRGHRRWLLSWWRDCFRVPGASAQLGQARRWRAAVGWYVLALGGPLVLLLLADLVYVALGGPPPQRWLALPTGGSLGFAIGSLIVGSLGEVFGWRGFAQPRLQSRYTALTASVIIGILW